MSLELWLAFSAATIVLLIIPGPTILTVVSYSVTHGKKAKLPLIAAVALGDSTALMLSVLGLGALLQTSATWFTVIKWAGGLYLIYMGIKLLRSRVSANKLDTPDAPESQWRLFANTWLVTALNPKGIIFFVAFLPQFIQSEQPLAPQMWILSITFVVLATVNAAAYATFAGTATRVLHSERAQHRFNLTGGFLLTAAGLWALTARPSS